MAIPEIATTPISLVDFPTFFATTRFYVVMLPATTVVCHFDAVRMNNDVFYSSSAFFTHGHVARTCRVH